MAEFNLGRVAFFDKGLFSLSETYTKWDFVTTADSTYLCVSDTPIIGKEVTNTTYWKCIADGKQATEAADLANAAASNADIKARLANGAAEAANKAAEDVGALELLIAAAESARVSAESLRVSAESARVSAEGLRATAESNRGIAEGARVTAEGVRVTAEQDRVTAEGLRVTTEQGRVTAEGLRVTAEQARALAEDLRVQAETSRNVTSNLYNVTVQVPLPAGQFYTSTTARAAVPTSVRKRGLILTYETSSGVWYSERFKGANISTWATESDWELVPSKLYVDTQDNLKIDKSSITQDFGTDTTKVVSQNFFTNTVRNIDDLMWYGVEWDITVGDTACTRIGNPLLHATLPIQSQIRRCLLLDTGVVNYYLSDTDSTKKVDGTNAILDGTDGQVMCETPAHYRKFEQDGNKVRCKISLFPLSGFHFVPRYYRSAYEATVKRDTNTLSSVVNLTANYRGGNNNATWDAESRTLLGRPASVISLTNFRAFARNRGAAWNCDVYELQKTWYWLYAVEYANFNSQLAYNAAPTLAGYKQGGLGAGVTTLGSTAWNDWNSYYPFVPCGHTNSLGNRTGIIPFDLPAEYGSVLTVQVPSYRGLENPFGHIWKWTDGCKVRIQANDAGSKSEFYVCLNPSQFQDTNYNNYLLRGELARVEGYIRRMLVGEFGENMPTVIGGTGSGSGTFFADYFYPSLPSSGESQRGVLFGGSALHGGHAGLGYSLTSATASNTAAYFGSRLCYIP